MEIPDLVLFFVLALLAEIIGTIGGFGSSVFFVPVASLFFDFHSVLGITAVFHLSSNASKIYLFKKGVDKQILIRFGIPSIFGVILGALASNYINAEKLEFSLGIFLVILAIVLLVFRNFKPDRASLIIPGSGAVSGITAGLLGTGGAVRGLALSSLALGKDSFIATSAIIDMGIDLSRTVVYGFNGYIHKHDLYLIPGLILIGFAGTFAGRFLLKYVSEIMFRNLVLALVAAIGISLIIKQIVN
jgi:uncharacterized membrane protein YfcA